MREKLHVSYPKDLKQMAKEGNERLFTIAMSWPGGKPSITIQGICKRGFEKEIDKTIAKWIKNKKI